eukprot:1666048-Rhodomonas_salina.5
MLGLVGAVSTAIMPTWCSGSSCAVNSSSLQRHPPTPRHQLCQAVAIVVVDNTASTSSASSTSSTSSPATRRHRIATNTTLTVRTLPHRHQQHQHGS